MSSYILAAKTWKASIGGWTVHRRRLPTLMSKSDRGTGHRRDRIQPWLLPRPLEDLDRTFEVLMEDDPQNGRRKGSRTLLAWDSETGEGTYNNAAPM